MSSSRVNKRIEAAGTTGLSKLLPVYLIVFFSFFDTHAQMPILAPYAESLGATPFLTGLVVGAYSFFNITGNLCSGIWIDRLSWKQPLIVGLAGVTVILLLYPFAGGISGLLTIRAAHGFLGGILVPSALACLTVNSAEREERTALAIFGAVIGLAAVSGPMFSGIIANRFSYGVVYFSLAGAMALATAASSTLLRYPEHNICPGKRSYTAYRIISGRPKILSAFFFALGTMGGTGTLASFLPTQAEMLGFNSALTGMLFATFALFAIILQSCWPLLRRKAITTDQQGGAAGLLVLSSGLVLGALTANAILIFFTLALFGIGFGLAFQGMLGLVISGSEQQWRGQAISLFFAVYSLGVALLPPLGGLIWQQWPAFFPFYTAALNAVFCAFCGYKIAMKNHYSKRPEYSP